MTRLGSNFKNRQLTKPSYIESDTLQNTSRPIYAHPEPSTAERIDLWILIQSPHRCATPFDLYNLLFCALRP